MDDKTVKVMTPHNTVWASRFVTEDAAWGRLLALKGQLKDTRANRAALLAQGWKVWDPQKETNARI